MSTSGHPSIGAIVPAGFAFLSSENEDRSLVAVYGRATYTFERSSVVLGGGLSLGGYYGSSKLGVFLEPSFGYEVAASLPSAGPFYFSFGLRLSRLWPTTSTPWRLQADHARTRGAVTTDVVTRFVSWNGSDDFEVALRGGYLLFRDPPCTTSPVGLGIPCRQMDGQ